ncbi:ROK family transcriptional regulator [Marinitoga sp. 1135]|nr:ROK family transcriptional regulator [Marinitoga sp. 1135]
MKNILRILHINNPISRKDIVKLTDLRPSSVTRLTRELIEKGYIYEEGIYEDNAPGRKKILLNINKEAFISLIVDVGVNETIIGFGYFNGYVEILKKILTPKDPEEFFYEIKKFYMKYKKIKNIKILSFSIPGLVDVEKNIILLAPNLGWKNVNIEQFLKLDIPILADNEANLSVIAEKYHAKDLKNISNIVFVEIREGIGTGIIINNQLYRGFSYSGGEFGHTVINMNSKEQCHCSRQGCWEQYGSILNVIKNYEGIIEGKDPIEKFENLKRQPNAKKTLLNWAENNAIGMANIINALNPEALIIGGELSDMPIYFYEYLIKKIRENSLPFSSKKTIIRPTIFKKYNSNLVGACIFSINKHIEEIK